MLLLTALLFAGLFLGRYAEAKAVFAHFMLGNTESFNVGKWQENIVLAQQAHIDAFALNIAHGWKHNDAQIANAFAAANAKGFKLFFSFDYAGGDVPWPLAEVKSLIQHYGADPAHFLHNGKPFVSTFEGPENADDWKTIKADTGCFFVPDWSSLGAGPALEAGNGVADGLFNWAAWPYGDRNMTTYIDASYHLLLGSKPYMMAVSPWFFTNLPGYNKNWLWKSGDLWYERWKEVLTLDFAPEFIEIISWNDYGESHYIGPLDDDQYEAFDVGDAPYNYVKDMPHDGWREHLPFLIDMYKSGTASFSKESLVTWFRTSLNDVCADGETTGNTASQLQLEYRPVDITPDRIYFSALLASNAELKVTFGGREYNIQDWDYMPDSGVGIYHTSIPVLSAGGTWHAQVVRGGSVIIDYSVPQGITGDCPSDVTNWNPWVGVSDGTASVSGVPARKISEQTCIQGWGEGNFNDICHFTCKYGYCPSGACICTNFGKALEQPESTGVEGFSGNGDSNYDGLCRFACNLGYCPPTACSKTKRPVYVPITSPFNPDTCVKGGGHGTASRLCSWTCSYGFCPIHSCFCTRTGALRLPPPVTPVSGVKANFGNDNGLCQFACSHGFCPSPECSSDSSGSEDDDGSGSSVDVVVGYFQADSILRRGCAQRSANFVPLDSVSHINAAYAYIEAESFGVFPVDGASTNELKQLTGLKSQAPGLHVWLSLGGWTFSTGSGRSKGSQDIFAQMVSSAISRNVFIVNLFTFMDEYAFDGVDVDWQWPESRSEAENYALLIQEMRLFFNSQSTGSSSWGISFTVPADLTIIQRFDLATMAASASWVNLVAYNQHSTDTTTTRPVSDISSLDSVIGALGKSGIPNSQVNLGIGFFGRSYTLSSDAACSGMGCSASDLGIAGQCTGTPGFMSYDEVKQKLGVDKNAGNYDETTATSYNSYDENQWISYENADSIIQKVKYVKIKGLLGLAVWAIDLDDDAHDLLNATLYPTGLGRFSLSTGTGHDDSSNYTDVEISSCAWSDCTASEEPKCHAGQQILTIDRCSVDGTGKKRYKALCCPLGQTPDSEICGWNQLDGGLCTRGCKDGQVPIASDQWMINSKGQEQYCYYGLGDYCCDAKESGDAVCGWENSCVQIGSDGKPTSNNVCRAGRKFVTYAKDAPNVGVCKGDAEVNSWIPYCCDEDVDTSSFAWSGTGGEAGDGESSCDAAKICPVGKTAVARSYLGGGADCTYFDQGYSLWFHPSYSRDVKRTLCAAPNALQLFIKALPVPVENLFPHPGPDTDKQQWDVKLDPTMGGADPTPEESTNADKNSFGWYIMSGPQNELTSLDKRDGSHWEIFDCEPGSLHEGRQTVRAVCTESSETSNCGLIHEGRGVAETVVEMPPECGPGRYAMAISLEPSQNQTLPHHLVKRELHGAQIYDFTFDYDFSPLRKRGKDSNVLLRIDYSDDPGYWSDIVAAAPTKLKRSKREIEEDVHTNHNGSYRQYMYHLWSVDKRSTPPEEMHELHARWFSKSGAVKDWIDRLRNVDTDYELVRHTVNQQIRWNLYDESVACNIKGVDTTGYFSAWADLNVNIQTSALLTLIGNLGDLSSFEESHVLFRNSGSVKAALNVEALVTMQFLTGQVEFFGLQNFGATFSVPGIVTIGPNFRVLGQLQGTATLHGKARVDLTLAEWDYTQQYPDANDGAGVGSILEDSKPGGAGVVTADPDSPLQGPKFYYDVDASGEISMTVTPQVTLGIVFHDESIPDASVDFGVNGRVSLYGSAGSSSDEAWQYCYGVNGEVDVFARISAPNLFGVDLNNHYTLWQTGLFPVVEQKCAAATSSVTATSRAIKRSKLVKRGDFFGSLICPAGTPDEKDVSTCPMCGEVTDNGAGTAEVKKRYGMLLERAEVCTLPDPNRDNPSCSFAGDVISKRDHAFLHDHTVAENLTHRSVSTLSDRSLSTKVIENVVIGNNRYTLGFAQYSPCSDAKNSNNVLKSMVFQNSGRRCNADVDIVAGRAMSQNYPNVDLDTDHVYEAQTLANFFSWLGRGPGTTVGTYSLPTEEWVVEVLLGIDLPGQGLGRVFDMDATPLGVAAGRPPAPVFDTMVYGFGRSDGTAGGPFTKTRGESHLVLLFDKINEYKGQWFKGNAPDETTDKSPKATREKIQRIVGTFKYLSWSPTGAAGAGPFPVKEPIWNKWMRVSNWIDYVCWSFDNQFANEWGTWPGAPQDSTGATPSLRALYARYIEDALLAIEGNVATYTTNAKKYYTNAYSVLRSDGSRSWSNSNTDDPAWFNSAFGSGGWATAAKNKFPRVRNGRAWSAFGATGNPSMTVRGDGTTVDIGPPPQI